MPDTLFQPEVGDLVRMVWGDFAGAQCTVAEIEVGRNLPSCWVWPKNSFTSSSLSRSYTGPENKMIQGRRAFLFSYDGLAEDWNDQSFKSGDPISLTWCNALGMHGVVSYADPKDPGNLKVQFNERDTALLDKVSGCRSTVHEGGKVFGFSRNNLAPQRVTALKHDNQRAFPLAPEDSMDNYTASDHPIQSEATEEMRTKDPQLPIGAVVELEQPAGSISELHEACLGRKAIVRGHQPDDIARLNMHVLEFTGKHHAHLNSMDGMCPTGNGHAFTRNVLSVVSYPAPPSATRTPRPEALIRELDRREPELCSSGSMYESVGGGKVVRRAQLTVWMEGQKDPLTLLDEIRDDGDLVVTQSNVLPDLVGRETGEETRRFRVEFSPTSYGQGLEKRVQDARDRLAQK